MREFSNGMAEIIKIAAVAGKRSHSCDNSR